MNKNIKKIFDLSPLLDKELALALEEIPEWSLSVESLPYLRDYNEAEAMLAPAGFEINNYKIATSNEGHQVPVRVYRPVGLDIDAPALIFIHGGGFVMGNVSSRDSMCLGLAHHGQCAVVSVGYRLAPEHPFPAAFDDCYATLEWLAQDAVEADLYPAKIAVCGISAGGGLAAGLALKSRDQKGPALAHQFLIIPDLDDRLVTASSHRIHDPRVWDRSTAEVSWQMYLGDSYKGDVSPYAAPARAADLSGLPPATVLVEDLDILRDEAVDYANRLNNDGVRAELHVYPGTFHGHFGVAPDAAISKRIIDDIFLSVKRVFGQALLGTESP
jgi:acetyl esterase